MLGLLRSGGREGRGGVGVYTFSHLLTGRKCLLWLWAVIMRSDLNILWLELQIAKACFYTSHFKLVHTWKRLFFTMPWLLTFLDNRFELFFFFHLLTFKCTQKHRYNISRIESAFAHDVKRRCNECVFAVTGKDQFQCIIFAWHVSVFCSSVTPQNAYAKKRFELETF